MLTGTMFRPVPGGGQTISSASSSAKATNPAPLGVKAVMVYCDQDVHVRFDVTGGAATTSDYFLPASMVQYLECPDGAYVHAIRNSADGTLRLHWML